MSIPTSCWPLVLRRGRVVSVLFILWLWMFSPIWVFASHEGDVARSTGALKFALDAAGFRAAEGKTFVEFYYSVPISQLQFVRAGDTFEASFTARFSILNDQGSTLAQDEWTNPIQSSTEQQQEGKELTDQFALIMDPGDYQVRLSISDKLGGTAGDASLNLDVPNLAGDSLMISDLQLASSIVSDSTGGQFVKNGVKVTPIPARNYSLMRPLLFFYFEIYGLAQTEVGSDMYGIAYAILDQQGNVVRSLPSKSKRKPGATAVEVGAANVAVLRDSVYTLRITATDSATGQSASTMRVFHVAQPEAPAVAKTMMDQEIEMMDDDEVEDLAAKTRYIMTHEEMLVLRDMKGDGVRKFMMDFWNRKGQDAWTEYMRRINYADENFAAGFKKGWKSDRGRIAIKYGIPNEIENHPPTANSVPYDVWIYYTEGGMRFVFAEESGFGQYRLIFSSDEREITDPNWQTILRQTNE